MKSDQFRAIGAEATVTTLFHDTLRARPGAVALRARNGETWEEWTWTELADQAARLAAGLGSLGVARGSRVVLMMRNRPEFHALDLAVLLCGATPISIYNSSAPEQIEYLVDHCEATVAIAEDVPYLERFLEARAELPRLEHLVVVDDPDGLAPADVVRIETLLAHQPVSIEEAVALARPEDLATVIYTSGTTGPPKGVMITHANVAWTIDSMRTVMARDVSGYRLISFLPMAHIAERMVTHYMLLANGYEVTTCPDPSQIADHLREVHPQIFFAVPRVWEKLHAGIRQLALSQGEERLAALEAGTAIGLQVAQSRSRGEELPAELQATWETADAAGLSMVRGLVGLDQCEVAFSGAAPIPTEVLEFFLGLGVPMSEIYGLSECCGPMTWEPYRVRVGTVGPAIPGVELRLLDDGEVCCRGGNVVPGYLKDPENTAATFDAEGWLHTGDIGILDDAGYLRIVDRKKELIITAGGKNVSPANVEAALKAFPLIGQACVIGDKRPFLTALIVLDGEVTPAWAASKGIDVSGGLAALAEHPEVRAEVERSVAEANKRFNNVEQVKKFRILAHEWPPDSEELTPTMKLKRRGVLGKYEAEIEAMYA